MTALLLSLVLASLTFLAAVEVAKVGSVSTREDALRHCLFFLLFGVVMVALVVGQ